MKNKSIKSIANSVFAKLPVIGPHAGIEAELLLAGMKPLGWLHVPPSHLMEKDSKFLPPHIQKEINDIKKLDDAVKNGQLRSYDVAYEQFQIPFKEPHKSISRHYAQPDKFHDMLEIASVNEDLFSGKEPRTQMTKSFGDYLGYRQKDQNYWEKRWTSIIPKCVLQSKTFWDSPIPKALDNISIFINVNIAQPAYQADQLRKAQEKQAQDKKSPAPVITTPKM